jgi:general secretion pathway protein N
MGGALVRLLKPVVWLLSGVALTLGVCLLLLGLLPARFAADALQSQSRGLLTLTEVNGRWWSGSARLGLVSANKLTMLPGTLTWRMSFAQAWRGSFPLQINAPALSDVPLNLLFTPTPSSQRIEAQAWRAQLPLAVLQGLGAPWNTLGLAGQLQSESSLLTVQDGVILSGASGTIQLVEVSSLVSPLKPLGTYSLRWTGGAATAGTSFTVATLRGPLLLEGNGALLAGKLRFDGSARSEPQAQAALANLLGIIGRRSSEAAGGDVVRLKF